MSLPISSLTSTNTRKSRCKNVFQFSFLSLDSIVCVLLYNSSLCVSIAPCKPFPPSFPFPLPSSCSPHPFLRLTPSPTTDSLRATRSTSPHPFSPRAPSPGPPIPALHASQNPFPSRPLFPSSLPPSIIPLYLPSSLPPSIIPHTPHPPLSPFLCLLSISICPVCLSESVLPSD